MLENIAPVIEFFKQLLPGYLAKKGLDQTLKVGAKTFALKAYDQALEKSAEQVAKTFGDPLELHFKKVFENKDIYGSFAVDHKAKRPEMVKALSKSLTDVGCDRKPAEVKKICGNFIDVFIVELHKAEKISLSEVAAFQQIDALHQHLAEEEKSKPAKALVIQPTQPSAPTKTVNTPPIDSDSEVRNSKYRKEIEDAKILVDRGQYIPGKALYESLLEKFKEDPTVPTGILFKVYNNLAICHRHLGETSQAISLHKAAYELIGKTSITACQNRAVASLLEDKPLEGIPFIDAALVLDPNNATSRNIKASLFNAAEMPDEVLKLYEKKETP